MHLGLRFTMGLSSLVAIAACSSAGTPTGAAGTAGAVDDDAPSQGMASAAPGAKTGTIELRLVDAPNDEVKEIVVSIDHIDVQVAGSGWSTLTSTPETVDLLKLQGGTFKTLGITTVPAGHVTQFRLYVVEAGPNYVTTPDGVHHALKVPSGSQSGIKLHLDLDLAACAAGYLTFDFDGKNSIFTHPLGQGAGDEWILRPVVRLKSVVARGTCDDAGAPIPPATDAAAPPASTDAGGVTPPPPVPPTTDPCATVTCTVGQTCVNGVCDVIIK